MASIRSFRMGLSKSYHSLNTLGNDQDNQFTSVNPNGNDEDEPSSPDWIAVDNRLKERNKNRPFHALKSAMSKVSRHKYKPKTSKSSTILREFGSEWRLPQEGINANLILG